jgi:hypothetical protein
MKARHFGCTFFSRYNNDMNRELQSDLFNQINIIPVCF